MFRSLPLLSPLIKIQSQNNNKPQATSVGWWGRVSMNCFLQQKRQQQQQRDVNFLFLNSSDSGVSVGRYGLRVLGGCSGLLLFLTFLLMYHFEDAR